MLIFWRVLIICGCGLVVSWVPVVYQIRKKAGDRFGMDLAMCLALFCIATMIGMSSAAIRHVVAPTTEPVLLLFSGAIFYGVRARVRWYLKSQREETP